MFENFKTWEIFFNYWMEFLKSDHSDEPSVL